MKQLTSKNVLTGFIGLETDNGGAFILPSSLIDRAKVFKTGVTNYSTPLVKSKYICNIEDGEYVITFINEQKSCTTIILTEDEKKLIMNFRGEDDEL